MILNLDLSSQTLKQKIMEKIPYENKKKVLIKWKGVIASFQKRSDATVETHKS